jgi:hypothetical protein
MTNSPLTCTKCATPLPGSAPGQTISLSCPRCAAELQVVAFPALYHSPSAGASAQLILTEGEAACFYHPEKRAVAPCDHCGRFLCALCDVGLEGKHFCPSCLEAGTKKGKMQFLERGRTRYDQVVWSLLILPVVVCWPATPLTAATALVVAIWKWRAPGSLVANTKLQLGLAMGLAVLELGASAVFWGLVYFKE